MPVGSMVLAKDRQCLTISSYFYFITSLLGVGLLASLFISYMDLID